MNNMWIIGGVNMLLIVMIILIGVTFLAAPEVILFSFGAFAVSYVIGSMIVPTFNPEWAFWVANIVLIALIVLKGFFNIRFNNTSRLLTLMNPFKPEEPDNPDNNS